MYILMQCSMKYLCHRMNMQMVFIANCVTHISHQFVNPVEKAGYFFPPWLKDRAVQKNMHGL